MSPGVDMKGFWCACSFQSPLTPDRHPIVIKPYLFPYWPALGELEGRCALATIANYSMKGGVGKTTIAVNLAWSAAMLSSRRTLLWDLDAQAAATFILAPTRRSHDEARAVL